MQFNCPHIGAVWVLRWQRLFQLISIFISESMSFVISTSYWIFLLSQSIFCDAVYLGIDSNTPSTNMLIRCVMYCSNRIHVSSPKQDHISVLGIFLGFLCERELVPQSSAQMEKPETRDMRKENKWEKEKYCLLKWSFPFYFVSLINGIMKF